MLNEVFWQIAQAVNIQQLDQIFSNSLEKNDIIDYCYSFYSPHFRTTQVIQHSLSSVKVSEWFDYFWRHDFDIVDPIGQQVRCQLLPLYWDLRDYLSGVSEKTKIMFQEAIHRQLHQGVSIPLHGPNNTFAILVLYLPKKKKIDMTIRIQKLHLIAIHYHAKLIEFSSKENSPPCLTSREIEILRFTALHKTAKEIALELNITERTVNFHIQNMNNKFHCVNKYESVTKAINQGILKG